MKQVKVLAGCPSLGISKGLVAPVVSVTDLGPDYSHFVKVVLNVRGRTIALYAKHKNRLSDPTFRLNNGDPSKVIVVAVVPESAA